jgi:hypothetical protein
LKDLKKVQTPITNLNLPLIFTLLYKTPKSIISPLPPNTAQSSTTYRNVSLSLTRTRNMMEEEIEKLRGVVRDCVSKHLYSSAIFFADKVAAFTNDPADIYMQAQALFLGRHFRRAFHLLNASQIVLRDLRFRYLAAKCLVRSYLLLTVACPAWLSF